MIYRTAIILTAFCATPLAAAWCQSCSVSATGVAFGSYQPLSGLVSNTATTITVTCDPGLISLLISYTIQLGTGSGGSFAGRSMSIAGSRLKYQLFRDALRTQIWGDGTSGTFTVVDGYLLGVLLPVTRSYPCYGSIPASQLVNVGVYSDVLSVLLSY
jgi:spore coat protein U-like protein